MLAVVHPIMEVCANEGLERGKQSKLQGAQGLRKCINEFVFPPLRSVFAKVVFFFLQTLVMTQPCLPD